MTAAQPSPSRRWPFWVLLAAWVCANSPQIAVYALLTWMAEARTFSHQQELSREVAHLLAGETAEGRVARALGQLKAVDDAPERPKVPLPAAAGLKKIDLAIEGAELAVRLHERGPVDWRREAVEGQRRPVTPAHGPPRTSVV